MAEGHAKVFTGRVPGAEPPPKPGPSCALEISTLSSPTQSRGETTAMWKTSVRVHGPFYFT